MWGRTEPAVIASEKGKRAPPFPPPSFLLSHSFLSVPASNLLPFSFFHFAHSLPARLGSPRGSRIPQRTSISPASRGFSTSCLHTSTEKKRKKRKKIRETEKRHHIPQPSVSPGRLRGIFSHTAQNALVRAERPHTLYHYHANREWSEQSCRKKERRGSYQCFHLTWGSHLNIWKICRKRPKVDIPGWNNVTVGSGESSPLMERDLCRKDSPSSRMCYSKDCKTLSKSELLSPQWFVHRKYKPRKSESNTAWFRFPETTYTFNSNFSLLQCSL